MNPENEKRFLERLGAGETVDLGSVEEFLDAAKLCRKRYGRKRTLPCDGGIGFRMGCFVILQEKPEITGMFCVDLDKVHNYITAHKMEWEQFQKVYAPEMVRKRTTTRNFMDADNQIHRHFNHLSDKRKKMFVVRLKEFISKEGD